jgi:hypothetical protein
LVLVSCYNLIRRVSIVLLLLPAIILQVVNVQSILAIVQIRSFTQIR